MDSSTKSAAIDFEHTDGALKGKAWRGIYALGGDTLMVCDNAPDLDKGRPVAFEAKKGSGHPVARASAEARAALVSEIGDALRPCLAGAALAFPFEAHLASARK